jgi:CheY-like chemotaxis protein
MLVKIFLNKTGASLKTVNDGRQGVDTALSENFDVVLMDVQMPVMDGHAATQKLRQNKYGKPIIALTAHAMSEERARCFESGFTDFLTKPIQQDLLINVLSRYMPGRIK